MDLCCRVAFFLNLLDFFSHQLICTVEEQEVQVQEDKALRQTKFTNQ